MLAILRSRTAAKFVDQHGLGLGAGDALHLAIASDHGATVHTLDQRLAEAGPRIAERGIFGADLRRW